ncbi:MAG: hypothetical protein AUJ92_14830 [Armatimonadetes bacterium CG2_30_59_28]|nr:MAG: hypothetical protein AUJ92_14830 [Armatimonadetes bacterium CG2_30_59_28]PIU65583.1 MAG: hypothetical protein COS85_08170 [Armatimonadetes bacterium CG07_land_8_20_14_0_80_59_28]PIX38914.1 MAG: hypothetical protein COZ56_19175 [Armatimonadetes bacterium CG_4_8_14_3_um_filter_58_9]PIY39223.1 MAG: hypothetical protein COZ05_19590 [Armatimonadetes bacterium CG_4_10_14_3_um_filter_59_10]
MKWYRWLTPGLRVKRWFALLVAGVVVAAIGAAVAVDIEGFDPNFFLTDFIYLYTKQYFSPLVAGTVLASIGMVLLFTGLRGYVRSIAGAISPDGSQPLIDVIYRRRHLEQGARIVALGGGTGLPVLLRGLKEFSSNITAIVTVSDDGGSSGRLRKLGFLPPGDIRNCLVALSDAEEMMERLFQHRFQGMGADLDGHCFGNLLIAAMTEISGDFDSAVKETSKVLAIRGHVLPATLENVVLCAELVNGETVRGQVAVSLAPERIRRAYLDPARPRALPEALDAIRNADAIVLGPGSLFGSVLPHLLVEDIRNAIAVSPAPRIYVCNAMTQPNETLGFIRASDHLRVLEQHAGPGIVDYIIANGRRPSAAILQKYHEEGADFVEADERRLMSMGVQPVIEEAIIVDGYVRHDPAKLAEIVHRIYERSRAAHGSRLAASIEITKAAA